jgi:DNA adenine methylase
MNAHKPILRWPGGKRRMLKHLLPMIPEHTCYCEPCAGGLAMLMAKERSPVEVVNDLNGDLVALYRNLQYHLPELLRQIEFMFSSREMLKDFVAQPGITEIQRAANFFLKNRTSFAGNCKNFAVVRTEGGGSAFWRGKATDLLGQAHARLDGVTVEHLSYERCLELYDSKDTFHFIDPPYLNAPTGAYDGFSEQDIKNLRKHVGKLKGKWIVTIDDSPLARDLFQDCKLTAITTQSGTVNKRLSAGKTFGELIIQPK